MKAAIYVRVSTADQHVESQLYDLRELAAKRGFEVVDVFRGTGFFDGKLHGLGSGHDEVFNRRPESIEEFEKVGSLGFGNHAAFQRAAMALSRR